MAHHRTLKTRCPACKEIVDGATNIGGKNAPVLGSLTVCIFCASVLVFDANLQLRLPTEEESEVASRSVRIMRAVQTIHDHLWCGSRKEEP